MNPKHIAGAMTKEEKTRTQEFLSSLHATHPLVVVRKDSNNILDDDAYSVWLLCQKVGYVRDRAQYKEVAHAALQASDEDYFMARVVSTDEDDDWCFYVEPLAYEEPTQTHVIQSKWYGWSPIMLSFSVTREDLDHVHALDSMIDNLTLIANHEMAVDEDVIAMFTKYMGYVTDNGRNALYVESKQKAEQFIALIEQIGNEELRPFAAQMEQMLLGMCSEEREKERREEWLPNLYHSTYADSIWYGWVSQWATFVYRPGLELLNEWLNEVEKILKKLPCWDANTAYDDAKLLSRCYYAGIPNVKMHQLLTLLLLRHRIREQIDAETERINAHSVTVNFNAPVGQVIGNAEKVKAV